MVPQQPRPDRWHVGKEIPLALIFALFLQTAGWVWWAATQSAKLDYIAGKVDKFEASQYTQTDARADRELAMERDRELGRRITVLEGSARSAGNGMRTP